MSEKRKCDECGAELPANAPQGLCPRCLLGMAIYLEPATPSPRSSAITTNPAKEPQTKPPPAGARRFGDYELLGEIARGGMGIVYKARQISLKRNVAVKLLAFGKFSSDEFIRRFRTEAETVASLRHPNIVGIHDFGEQDGQYFFAMEYVEGENLAQKAAERPLPPRLAAKYLEAIARAVHYAHEHGVLHRDLKPGNVLIDQRDEPHVTDFGLAKRLRADLDLSLADQVVGTPNFAAPEQIRGKSGSLGPACDIYSLGALLYYLVTGRAPFAGETIEETLNLVLHTQPVAPRLLNPRAPRDLETICLKCMRADPSARYRSADELADDLNNWLAGKPILARPIRWPERASSWARRNPAVFGLTTATLLLLLALSIGSPFAVYRIRREALAAKQLLNETRLRRAENLFDADDTSAALAHLARVLRDDPTDTRAATRIYSALTQRSFPLPLFTPFAKNGFLTWAQWNYDSTRIATTDARGVVDLWDSEIGRHVLRFVAHAGAISSIRFSPDGARLITASEDGTARVWSSLDGQAVTLPLRHTKVVLFANFSPNSDQVVTCSADGTARLWDAQKGEPLAGPLTHSNAVNYAEFSPDGLSIVTAARDNTARLWSTKDGTPMGKPLAHKGWVISACFSPGGRQIVTASRDGTARVWDARSGKPLTGTLDLDGPGDWAEFSPDGQAVVTVSLIATARVWDARTGKPITPPLKHNGRVSSAHFSPDGQRIVTASLDRSARIWDARTGKALSERVRHEAGILSAQFETGGQRVLTASADSTAQLWDSRPASALEHRLRHEGGLNRAQFSPDGLRVLTASRDGTTRLWDAISGKPLISLRHAGRVQFASFNPDGSRLLTASQTGTAQIWDSATGQPCGAAFKHDASVECARFSPDGKRIVTGTPTPAGP
jgi:WD40 repeat protein/serine/threonine protein kinase